MDNQIFLLPRRSTVLVFLCVILLTNRWSDCVPVNAAINNRNNEERYIHRPLRSNPPPRHHGSYHQQEQQHGSPETQDSWRIHPNQNQFKRQAGVPPDVPVAPVKFQHNPPEPSNNFYYTQDVFDRHQSHIFRHQHQVSPVQGDTREHVVMRQGTQDENFPDIMQGRNDDDHHHRSQPRTGFGFANLHREETYFSSREPYIVPPHLFNNAIRREKERSQDRNVNPEVQRSSHNDRSQFLQHSSNSVQQNSGKQQKWPQDNRMPATTGTPAPARHRDPGAVGVTATAPATKETSTLLIEYDVSDNDVTYETTMEVDDAN